MRITRIAIWMVALFLSAGTAMPSQADPISYTLSGIGNAFIGPNYAFISSTFNITATANTNQVTNPLPGIYVVPNLTTTLSYGGSPILFTIPTITVINQNNLSVGISDPNQNLAILSSQGNPEFGTYNLTSPIGSLFGGQPIYNTNESFATTAGNFRWEYVRPDPPGPGVTFQAVPEPCVPFLGLAVGVAGLFVRRRRSR